MNGSNAEQPALDNAPTASLPNGPSSLPSIQQRLKDITSLSRNVSFVYLAHCAETGLYKIGMSGAPATRLQQLNADSAYPITMQYIFMVYAPIVQQVEQLLHKLFARCRTHGEWFKLNEEEYAFFGKMQPLWGKSKRYSRRSAATVISLCVN